MEPSFDALIVKYLGEGFRGRRYLRYRELHALGLVHDRAGLRQWIERGGFPAPLKVAGPQGRTTLWPAIEIAQHIATRFTERDQQHPTRNEEGAPLLDFDHGDEHPCP
jgi:hypothetical protein